MPQAIKAGETARQLCRGVGVGELAVNCLANGAHYAPTNRNVKLSKFNIMLGKSGKKKHNSPVSVIIKKSHFVYFYF